MRGCVCPCHRGGGSGEPAPGKLPGEVFTGGGRGMRHRVSHAGVGVRDGERRPEAGGSPSEVAPLPGAADEGSPLNLSQRGEWNWVLVCFFFLCFFGVFLFVCF